jgi:hypothetical protein
MANYRKPGALPGASVRCRAQWIELPRAISAVKPQKQPSSGLGAAQPSDLASLTEHAASSLRSSKIACVSFASPSK